MTDEELIEELSEMGRHPCRAHLPMGERLRQASDRIEALTAENERLREALKRIARYDVGLQSLIEDGADTPENRAKYYEGRVEYRRSIARAALEKQP
jgi:hypothetical protein